MHASLCESGGMHEVAGDQRWEAGLTSGLPRMSKVDFLIFYFDIPRNHFLLEYVH